MPKQYFSIREANEIIQKVKPLIEQVARLREELDLIDNTKIEFDNDKTENYLLEVELNKNFHEKNLEFFQILGEIIKMGCIPRNLDDIELDFYSMLGEKEIVFCWSPGQDKILYWHYPNEEKKFRKPIREIETNYLETLKRFK